MALYIRQSQEKNELQEQIAAELREKQRKRYELEKAELTTYDGSKPADGTKQTTSLAWAWILILIAMVGITVWIMIGFSD